ncbi:MAG: SMI1/KNR4 family protein [Tenacibaculum sp.]|nr:SMI1/KNR4 family protein [Tenacibaculum sp.]
MNKTLIEINKLIEKNNGKPILLNENDEDTHWFKCNKKYTKIEIEQWEKSTNIPLPKEYKEFLITVGACELYFNNYGGIEFYQLEKLKSFAEEVFGGDWENPFPKLLFIGSIFNTGDIIGYNLTKKSKNNLSVYGVWEFYPEEWLNNINEFVSLSYYLQQLVNSNGKKYSLL